MGTDYMFASESVVCDGCSFSDFEDIKPGEAVIVNKNKTVIRRLLVPKASFSPCIFEYVYFSRPDSIIDGISVYKARLAMGEALADQVLEKCGADVDIDVIIPVRVTTLFSCDCAGLEVIIILTSNSVYFWDTKSGSRYESRGRSADSVQTGHHLSRGVHQKSVYWTHLHHAWPGYAQKDCPPQVQCHVFGVFWQERSDCRW